MCNDKTLELPNNKEMLRCDRPAIIIAAFGSTKRGRAVFTRFHHKVVERYGEHDVYWAYTSKIIRKRTGGPGLHQTLNHLQSSGYSSIAIVPLQVFPGGEYQRICHTAACFTEVKVAVGETLMQREDNVREVLSVVERDFLTPEEGLNLLALHGTPISADPVNGSYLCLQRLVSEKYKNVHAAALAGIPDHGAVIAQIAKEKTVKNHGVVRIIPLLLVAGMHVEKDLMGDSGSWKCRLEKHGFTVECQRVKYSGESFFKSLASYPEIEELYMQRLGRVLQPLL